MFCFSVWEHHLLVVIFKKKKWRRDEIEIYRITLQVHAVPLLEEALTMPATLH